MKKLSQARLADMSGVSKSAISRFCNGAPMASDKLLLLLGVCEDLSLDWLFWGRGQMFRRPEVSMVNAGVFSSADFVSEDSVVVKNANGVSVQHSSDRGFVAALAEKDRIIMEKDRTISERDAMILQLHEKLLG